MTWERILRVMILASVLLSGFSLPNTKTGSIGLSRRGLKYPNDPEDPAPALRPQNIDVEVSKEDLSEGDPETSNAEELKPDNIFYIYLNRFPELYQLKLIYENSGGQHHTRIYTTERSAGIIIIPEAFLTETSETGAVGRAELCLEGWKHLKDTETVPITEIAISIPSDTSTEWANIADDQYRRNIITGVRGGSWWYLHGEFNELYQAIRGGPIGHLVRKMVGMAPSEFTGSGNYFSIRLYEPDTGSSEVRYPAIVLEFKSSAPEPDDCQMGPTVFSLNQGSWP